MSIMYCEKHDMRWDSDKLDECPLCENEPSPPITAPKGVNTKCPLCHGALPQDNKTLSERLDDVLTKPLDVGEVLDPTDERLKTFSKPERRRIIAAMCACDGISTAMLEATCPSEFDLLKQLEEKLRASVAL